MRYSQGLAANPAPTATFRNYLGVLADPTSVTVDLFDPMDVAVVSEGDPDHIDTGRYSFPYTFEEDAELGIWHIVWNAIIDGAAVSGDEFFEVVPEGTLVITTTFDRLRRMVGERIPAGKTDDDTFFTDAEMADILDQANYDMNRAAMYGWFAKMAEFAKLIDRNTSGADLELSQMYKHSESMFKWYTKLSGDDAQAVVGRVVGRAINLREDASSCSRVTTGAGAYRPELYNSTARRLLFQKAPELLEEDPSYPQAGQVAT